MLLSFLHTNWEGMQSALVNAGGFMCLVVRTYGRSLMIVPTFLSENEKQSHMYEGREYMGDLYNSHSVFLCI